MKRILFYLDNEPMSGITHFIGFLCAVAGLVLLTVFASLRGTAWHVVSFSIFGASMVLLYAASSVYHFVPVTSRVKSLFQRIDQSMVYILIAGTYTPIALVTLRGPWGWSLFGVIWGLALMGVVLRIRTIAIPKFVSLGLYLVMGWLALIFIFPLTQQLSSVALFLLFLGGAFYTIGSIAFALGHITFHPKWFGMHEVFHIFVMCGSAAHFYLIFGYVL